MTYFTYSFSISIVTDGCVQDVIIVKEIDFDFGLCLLPVELVSDHVGVVDALLQVASLLLELVTTGVHLATNTFRDDEF